MRVLLISFILIISSSALAEDDYGKSMVPDALLPFYEQFMLAFHYHHGTPQVYDAQCYEQKTKLCLIFWTEPLPSNIDNYVSIVNPFATDSIVQMKLDDSSYPLGYTLVNDTLVISIIEDVFDGQKWQASVLLYQFVEDRLHLLSRTEIPRKPPASPSK
jgi:hypothetical protein